MYFASLRMDRLRELCSVLSRKIVNFARSTTIHGVPIIATRKLHILERLIWTFIIVLATYASVQLSVESVQRYYANPTVVSIQKDYRNWFNPFPSATACFANRVDEYLIDEYIEETWGLNASDTKYEYYREFVMDVTNISYESLSALGKYADDDNLNNVNLLQLAARVHPELTGTLVTFDTERKTDWRLVMTELGICFSVNTKIAKYFTYTIKGRNDTMVEDDIEEKGNLRCHYLNGLCYARYDSDPLAPLKIYVHSYLDIAHATSEEPLIVKESQELEINFKMHETTANINLRSLSPSQRKCRFEDEPLTADIPAYSRSICYINCRYRLVMKLCGCRPFFYHTLPGKLCDLKGLACVAQHSEKITRAPIELGCKCPQTCDFITYLPQASKISMWEYGYFDQRLTFRWGLLPPTTKYHRDIIFSFEDLVVSIGGTLALFLGVSFITAMEVVFFVFDFLSTLILYRQKSKFGTHKTLHSNNVKILNPRKIPIRGIKGRKRNIPRNRETIFVPYMN